MVDLVCIGNPAVDLIRTDKKRIMRAGSPAMNTAVVFSQLGRSAGIIGRIGKDKYGRFLKSQFKRYKIDTTRLREDSNPTNIVDVKTTKKERYIKVRQPYYTITKLSSSDYRYVNGSRAVFYRLAHSFSLLTLKLLEKTDSRIYLIAHFYRGPPIDHALDLRKHNIAAVIGTVEEVGMVRRYCKLPRTVPMIMTNGGKGSSAIAQGKTMHVPAFKVKVADPTGAGDAFAAGYIFADLQGLAIRERLRFGNACAAMIIQKVGAQHVINIRQIESLTRK